MGLTNYVKETKGELKHVNWPTRRQAIVFTIVVISISLFTAIFLSIFDYVFSYFLKLFI